MDKINIWILALWINLAIASVFAIVGYLNYLYRYFVKSKKEDNLIMEFFQNELVGIDLRNTSKQMKKIWAKVTYLIINISFLGFLIGYIIAISVEQREFLNATVSFQWKLFLIPILSFLGFWLFLNILLFITTIFLYKKEIQGEISDLELANNFKDFYHNWILRNGVIKQNYYGTSTIFYVDWYFNKQKKDLQKSLKFHKKFSKNYDYWVIEGFKRYLLTYRKFIITQSNNNIEYRNQLKFILIHNFFCELSKYV